MHPLSSPSVGSRARWLSSIRPQATFAQLHAHSSLHVVVDKSAHGSLFVDSHGAACWSWLAAPCGRLQPFEGRGQHLAARRQLFAAGAQRLAARTAASCSSMRWGCAVLGAVAFAAAAVCFFAVVDVFLRRPPFSRASGRGHADCTLVILSLPPVRPLFVGGSHHHATICLVDCSIRRKAAAAAVDACQRKGRGRRVDAAGLQGKFNEPSSGVASQIFKGGVTNQKLIKGNANEDAKAVHVTAVCI